MRFIVIHSAYNFLEPHPLNRHLQPPWEEDDVAEINRPKNPTSKYIMRIIDGTKRELAEILLPTIA
jgi:hypothetical protein